MISIPENSIWSEKQLRLFEDALLQICEEARRMSDEDWETHLDGMLLDNQHIARGFECLVGVATEEPISIK